MPLLFYFNFERGITMNVGTQPISLIGVALGLTSLGYSIYTQRKFKKEVIDKISENLVIDIPEAVVNEAINIAVEREVSKVVKRVSEQITHNARNDIHREVKSTVDVSFSSIKSSVSDEVAKQVATMDMRELKKEVKEKAKEMVIEKFDENLESLLSDFNDSLSNMSKIYSSIADSMKQRNSETVLRIGV